MTPHVPGWHTLCPSRWTKRAASLESILQNYPTLFATGEEAAEVAKQPDVKARINGVAAQMKEFKFFYCFMLVERLLKHCNNLSKTIQATSMPAVEARRLSELCIEVFQRMRNDSDFDLFWQLALQTREQLHINEPVLPANEREQDSLVKWEQKSLSFLMIQNCTTEVSIFSVWMQQWHLLRIVFINVTTEYIVT